jgi:AcrR family transcriptional regulator
MPARVAMKPWSPSPCTAGASRTEDERAGRDHQQPVGALEPGAERLDGTSVGRCRVLHRGEVVDEREVDDPVRLLGARPQTTVAEIAERAGLTERTVFPHFADKREVLFSGASLLQDLLVSTVANAPASTAPLDAVAAALDAGAGMLQARPDFSRERQAVITAIPALQERELIKMASLAAALAETLRQRGVSEPAASLTAEAGIAVFRVAFERWIKETEGRHLQHLVRDSLDELRAVTGGS